MFAATVSENGGKDVASFPSEAVTVMFAQTRVSPLVGTPANAPVVALNFVQLGWLVIENARRAPWGSDAVGVKLHASPTSTFGFGVPAMTGGLLVTLPLRWPREPVFSNALAVWLVASLTLGSKALLPGLSLPQALSSTLVIATIAAPRTIDVVRVSLKQICSMSRSPFPAAALRCCNGAFRFPWVNGAFKPVAQTTNERESRSYGSPAIMRRQSRLLDRRFCVTVFRQFCPWNGVDSKRQNAAGGEHLTLCCASCAKRELRAAYHATRDFCSHILRSPRLHFATGGVLQLLADADDERVEIRGA